MLLHLFQQLGREANSKTPDEGARRENFANGTGAAEQASTNERADARGFGDGA